MSDKGVSALRLKSFIERIERLEEERKAIGADIREVFSEAKSAGFDVKIMRMVLKIRKLDAAERQEQEALMAVYLDAIGEAASTPLGKAAIAAAKVETAATVREKRANDAVRNTPAAKKIRGMIESGEMSIEFPNGDGTSTVIDRDGTHTKGTAETVQQPADQAPAQAADAPAEPDDIDEMGWASPEEEQRDEPAGDD